MRSLSGQCARVLVRASETMTRVVCGVMPRLPGSRASWPRSFLIFLRVGFGSHQGGWPYFSFNIHFLLSHQTDDILVLLCDLQGILGLAGGQLRVGAGQADDGACVCYGGRSRQPAVLPTPCRGFHGGHAAPGWEVDQQSHQYSLSWWPSCHIGLVRVCR